jgi:hypothetical protein
MISNRDIGFVSAGQQAEVKIDTFNFTRYGLLRGKVVSVSQDAIVRDKPNAKAGNIKAWRRLVEFERAGGAGVALLGADRAGGYADADRGQAGQSRAGHGRHHRDQDRNAAADRISDVAAIALSA